MFKKMTFSISTLVLGAALLLSRSASADMITLSLTNPVQTGAGGSTLSFDATVTAPPKNGGTVFLNADSFNVASPLTGDDDGFILGFPFTLDPGDSFTGLLFTITLPPDVVAGPYLGSFSMLGGVDGGAQDLLATVDFTVNATNTSAVPEPGSVLLLATGLMGLMGAMAYKRAIV